MKAGHPTHKNGTPPVAPAPAEEIEFPATQQRVLVVNLGPGNIFVRFGASPNGDYLQLLPQSSFDLAMVFRSMWIYADQAATTYSMITVQDH